MFQPAEIDEVYPRQNEKKFEVAKPADFGTNQDTCPNISDCMWESGEDKVSSRKWEKAEGFYRGEKKDVKMPSIINESVYKNTAMNYWTIHVNSL